MAQLSPTTLYLAQAARIISFLKREFNIKQFKSNDEIIEVYNKALTKFEESVGKSLTAYEPVVRSEVPDSNKFNQFWNSTQNDMAILQDQVDLLNASAVDLHNFIKTQILKAQEDNLVSQNKIKTLEMYANISDPSLIYFRDSFLTDELIDWSAQGTGSNRLEIVGKKAIGLGVEVRENAFSVEDATVKILEGSNGFIGNNQEIIDPQTSTTNPTTNTPTYIFRQESYAANDLAALIDNTPTTWIEFEKYEVKTVDQTSSLNHNFSYKYIDIAKYSYLKPLVQANSMLNWADGAPNGLKLNIEIDLRTAQKVNVIKLLPYGLQNNINNPILIKSITTSLDKTFWFTLHPENVYLANGIDRTVVNVSSYYIYIGEGSWVATGDPIRYIRFEIVQDLPITTKIGHHYYKKTVGGNAATPLFDAGGIGSRVVGPVPPIDKTNMYFSGRNLGDADLVQNTEYFTGKRWVIGIRDISISNNIYYESGSFVSKPFDIAGIVDRVSISCDVYIPENYDKETNWIKFFISPDNGSNWFQISRIQDDFLAIPEIIAFNDPTPVALREAGIGYYETTDPVTTLRLKVEISRPKDYEYSTPLLQPYTLKIKKRI